MLVYVLYVAHNHFCKLVLLSCAIVTLYMLTVLLFEGIENYLLTVIHKLLGYI